MNQRMCNYMKTISNMIETIRNRGLDELNLTATQADIMFEIVNSEELLTQRDIERIFKLSNPTVNGLLNRLEKKGFIERKICETDLRCKHIIPTDLGLSLKEKMLLQAGKISRNITQNITDEEREVMFGICEKILNNLKNEKGEI